MSGVFRHGIYINEVSTDLVSLAKQTAGLTLVIGTAPIHLASDPAASNEPVLCSSYQEAVKKFGYSSDTTTYTLCEAMEVLFGLYNMAPVVFVNVLDPLKHGDSVEKQKVTLQSKKNGDKDITLFDMKSTGPIYGPSFQLEDENGNSVECEELVFHTSSGVTGIIYPQLATSTKIYASFRTIDPTKVAAADVIGGVDTVTGKTTGLEVTSEVYPRLGLTIGQIIAPRFSQTASVATAMSAKAQNINGHFSALAIADLPAGTGGYATAMAKKNTQFARANMAVCYPMVSYGDRIQHLSTHLAGVLSRTAQNDDDIPYRSPGNQLLMIDGMVNEDGSDNYFGLIPANELNGAGIVTVLRQNGWRVWGDRTSVYPSNSDPKDCWISVRRMFDFIKAALVENFWSRISMPITRREIDAIVVSANTYFNGLASRGALLGGRIEFLREDNSDANLMNGILYFRCYITPPSPAEEIVFTLEYDPSYQSSIFEG